MLRRLWPPGSWQPSGFPRAAFPHRKPTRLPRSPAVAFGSINAFSNLALCSGRRPPREEGNSSCLPTQVTRQLRGWRQRAPGAGPRWELAAPHLETCLRL